MVKHIYVKETLFHSKQQNNKQGNKNIPPVNKQSKVLLGNCSATDESNKL